MSKFIEKQRLLTEIDWQKVDNLIPAIIQHESTYQVLMLGYMNQEALTKTLATNQVTFFSRTKARLWTKGETSKHFLIMSDISLDCDKDTLLIKAMPQGPTCHLGTTTCFDNADSHLISNSVLELSQKNVDSHQTFDALDLMQADLLFLQELEQIIAKRKNDSLDTSYTSSLFAKGTKRIAQKVGEEGVEVALAAMAKDKTELLNESADLIYHLLVLLKDQDCSLLEVMHVLKSRKK